MEGTFYFLLILGTLASASVPSSAILNTVSSHRHRRSFKVPLVGTLPSLFAGREEPQVPHLGQYPLWKVHRYHGISVQPIPFPAENVPTQPGEPPSIVNIPDPYYAPLDTVQFPPNEYGPPANPSLDSSPLPPSSPYSPPGVPVPREMNVANAVAGSDEYASPPNDSQHVFDSLLKLGAMFQAGGSAGSEGGLGNVFDLQSLLSPELSQRLQQYIATPEGRERVSALLAIAANAKKLKVNAARSLHGVLQKVFGGAGGATNVALESGTYTNIPTPYPAPQGILNSFRVVGTGVSGSPLPNLPDVPPLPEIPGMQSLPPTPQLPHINLPDISNLSPNPGGQYVKINLPQPVGYEVPEGNAQTYGLPAETYGIPTPTYGVPNPPSATYGAPNHLSATYDAPNHPSATYGAPNPPSATYGAPNPPSTSYGVPSGPIYPYQPQTSRNEISTSFELPKQTYGVSYDSSLAASDTHEQFVPLVLEPKNEAINNSPVPLKTTKLHRVQDTQPFESEDLRRYLDSNHPAAVRPTVRELDARQSDNDIAGDSDGLPRS